MIKFDFCSGDWDEEIKKDLEQWLKEYKCKFIKMRKIQDDYVVFAEAPNLLALGKFTQSYNADWGEIKTEADVVEYFNYLFGDGDGWQERVKRGRL